MEVFGGIVEGGHGKLNMEQWNRLAVVAGRFFLCFGERDLYG